MFIWGEDASAGATSSTIRDPLTGTELRRLKHNGVEVTSRIGFETLRPEGAAVLIVYSSTIVNNTKTELFVAAGRTAIDGSLVSPLSVKSAIKGMNQRPSQRGKEFIDIRHLHCVASGYLSSEAFSMPTGLSSTMLVEPQSSLTLSEVVRDPRYSPLLCAIGGCHPKGTIRYSIHVGSHEYIFAWDGASVANCGK